MIILQFLGYINKISLLIFFITLGFLGYQFYLFKKDLSELDKKDPNIPEFSENIDAGINFTPLKNYQDENRKIIIEKRSPFFLYGGVLALITFLIFIVISFKTNNNNQQISFNQDLSPTPTVFMTNKYQSLSPTINESQEITPTQEILPTSTTIPTPSKEIILASPTIVEPTEILSTPTTIPTTITQLPVTGIFDKSIFMFGSALTMILFSLIF
ncbi:MAG: hypothetical protein Fur009_3460 [Candidatus Microgenomates bacterium]